MSRSLVLRACWPLVADDRAVAGGAGRWVREVGRGVSRCSGAPQLAASLGGVPRWEAFPEVNRALVGCLLGLLVERMMAPLLAVAGRG